MGQAATEVRVIRKKVAVAVALQPMRRLPGLSPERYIIITLGPEEYQALRQVVLSRQLLGIPILATRLSVFRLAGWFWLKLALMQIMPLAALVA